jgi:hypothetical protein
VAEFKRRKVLQQRWLDGEIASEHVVLQPEMCQRSASLQSWRDATDEAIPSEAKDVSFWYLQR